MNKIGIIIVFLGLLGCGQTLKESKTLNNENSIIMQIPQCDSCKANNFGFFVFADSLINDENLYKFLLCCNSTCADDVEFSEFSNGVLFMLLQNKSEVVLQILEKHNEIPLDFILLQLENPIDEDIDLLKTFEQLEKANGDSIIKNKLLKSVKVAIDKG